jgi:hypothetical protein
MDAGVREAVDLALKKCFEVLAQRHKIEQGTSGFHLDQQIQVTVGTVLTPRRGAEDPEVASSG